MISRNIRYYNAFTNTRSSLYLLYLQVLLETVSVNASETVIRVVHIDSSIGRETEFIFTYNGSSFTLDVIVTSPSGVDYTTNGTHSHINDVTKHVTISFNETEVRGACGHTKPP